MTHSCDKIIKDSNRLIELSLNIANIVDRRGEQNYDDLSNELNLGYRALSTYLRQGAKAIIDMEDGYSEACLQAKLAEQSEQDARDFLQDIFGDSDVDSLSNELKDKIRKYVTKLLVTDED